VRISFYIKKVLTNVLCFFQSLFFFTKTLFVKRSYQVIFYYPQHFNRGEENKNLYFKHLLSTCDSNNISYIIFEEPDFYTNKQRNNSSIPFDFIFFLIVLMRKFFSSEMDDISKHHKIGHFFSRVILYNLEFRNVITISQSMVSFFRGLNKDCNIYDVQHGIIHNNKPNYILNNKAIANITENNLKLLLTGNKYKELLIKHEFSSYFKENTFVIGSHLNRDNTENIFHKYFNNNILITLQLGGGNNVNENKLLYRELIEFINLSGLDVNFYLKHHPRFNDEFDILEILKLPNVHLTTDTLDECFKLCSLHATAYSTTTFEAALMGIPTVLICTRNKFNYFKLDFKYPLDNKILDFKDKIFFQTSSNIIRDWSLEYYNLFDKKKFLNLLK
jgi:hypothetical protein